MSEVVYDRGALDPEKLQLAISEFLGRIDTDSETQRELSALGMTPADIAQLKPEVVRVKESEPGLTGLGEAIIIALIIKAGEIVIDQVIDHIIVPYIKRRYGANAVGKRRS